ncbi:tetratricopeptide repeat protein, partial [Fusobacterium periodonticum]|uniref:tetratricopeptide repeat protein n=1 Tax=Fusobacterium periodonticum TaxID=860 RepID=UPI0028D14FF6
ELNPNNASYYFVRGYAYGKLEKYQEAIKDYDKAIELNPNNASYYFVRGYAYGELEKYQEAIKDYDKAIELNPNYKSAIENKEFSLKKLKNFSQTSEISEPKYQIIFNKAKALHLQGEIDDNFKKSEKEFSSFINKHKDSPNKSPELKNLLTEATSYLIASKFKVKRFIGYLTFADILGWKGIWQKQNTPNGKINYAECLFSIKNSLKNKFNNEQNFYNINLISDTFVIFSEDFKQSNELSKILIEQCLEKGLLIRGATSYGECYNKDMVYVGQAVDEAASWHEKGEEIGIFYTSSARLSINLSDFELEKYHLKNDEVNTKIGKIKTYFINWYDETTEKKFYEIMKKEIIYPEISLKYFNTENRLNKILHPEKEEKE